MLVVSSRREAAAAAAAAASPSNMDATQLEFSESMRRTQEAVAHGGCLSRWCCRGGSNTDDKYAVDLLATEIDSLQRTVKEVSPFPTHFNSNLTLFSTYFLIRTNTNTNAHNLFFSICFFPYCLFRLCLCMFSFVYCSLYVLLNMGTSLDGLIALLVCLQCSCE